MSVDITQAICATYRVLDDKSKLAKRAEGIAVGLTVGSWTDLPVQHQEAVRKHCGQVVDISLVEGDETVPGKVTADLTVAYPIINFTTSIAAILTTVFGKLSMDGQIRLVRLHIPNQFASQFSGPKFGVEGIRAQTGVFHRPFVMSIFKACVGRSLEDLTAHFREQALGGVDFIKDDEIFFTEAYATPEERVVAYGKVAREVADLTGTQVSYAVNLTGPVPQLFDRARRLANLGAGALLLNVFAYGYDVLHALATDPDVTVPILAHPAVSGALYAAPHHGIAADIVLGQLLRLAGADMVLYPSAYGSVTLPSSEGQALVEALRVANGLRVSLPVPSAGIHPGLVPTLVRDFGKDVVINAGGGIHGHPGGSTAGGKACVDAVAAVMADEPLSTRATSSRELAQALELWGEATR